MNDQNNNLKEEDERPNSNRYLIPSPKRLYLSQHNYLLLGVSGGIADYISVSPYLIRAIFIITGLLGGWGIVAYLICAVLIPDHPSQKPNGKLSKLNSSKFVGLSLIGVGIYYWLPSFGIFRLIDSINLSRNFFIALLFLVSGFYFILVIRTKTVDKEIIKPKKLERSLSQRRLLGLCGGLSTYLSADINLIRMFWVLLSFITLGLAGLFYLVAAYFIPNQIIEDVTND